MRINIDYSDLDRLFVKYQATQEQKLTREEVKFIQSVLFTLAELSGERSDSTEDKQEERVRFILNGCDISFTAEGPSDMTLAQLLKQCDRITPDWCACGLRSYKQGYDYSKIEVLFGYDDVKKADEDVCCTIKPKEMKKQV